MSDSGRHIGQEREAPIYLGEMVLDDLAGTPFSGRKNSGWCVEFITRYGHIDGAHHKAWLLDQLMRILLGTPVIVRRATWSDGGQEYRFRTGEPSEIYLRWVREVGGEDYDPGIAP